MKNDVFVDLLTPEGETLTGQPWPVYPRPQMRRSSFFCLNGEWDFLEKGGCWEKITVPYPPQSILSGIHREIKSEYVLYEKKFTLPKEFLEERALLHFGAIDQIAKVTLNGKDLGTHRGGYEAFSFDITDYLEEENILTVSVTDQLETNILPYGKQRTKRGGMWFTPIIGIWQTVWIESVPSEYIKRLFIRTGTDFVDISIEGPKEGLITVFTPKGEIAAELLDGKAHIVIAQPRMWSPEDPYLYQFTIKTEMDSVDSYFALRTLEIKTIDGIARLCLNGSPYFFHGLLDQGYYSDGIFTPACPESFTRDICTMKELGFNTLRKHIKVEPEQFYYDCDRLGMIVFQDMVNNGDYSFLRDTALPTIGLKQFPDRYMHQNKATRMAFTEGMKATVEQLYNHPCICYWTIFNEGWGQFESKKMYHLLKSIDDTRFIDTASGWFSGAPSDVKSIHVYFKPIKIKTSKLPVVLSEFGGYSYQPEGHIFHIGKPYGYRFFHHREKFEDELVRLYEKEIIPALCKGLCAAIYTQVSDVEDETNGLLSYDRKVLKVSKKRMKEIADKLKF